MNKKERNMPIEQDLKEAFHAITLRYGYLAEAYTDTSQTNAFDEIKKILEALKNGSVDIDKLKINEDSLIILAINHNEVEVVNSLLRVSQDCALTIKSLSPVDCRIPVMYGYASMVALLIKNDIDVNATGYIPMRTPIAIAAMAALGSVAENRHFKTPAYAKIILNLLAAPTIKVYTFLDALMILIKM